MKKKIKKASRPATRMSKHTATTYSRFIFIGISVLVVAFLVSVGTRSPEKPYVLGTSILARGGDDSGGGSGSSGGGESSGGTSGGSTSGSTTSGTSNTSGSGSSGGTSGGTSGGGEIHTSQPISENSPSGITSSAFVDCVGPDNKHFQTTFKACADLNHAFHHDNFSFTILKPLIRKSQPVLKQSEPEPSKSETEIKKVLPHTEEPLLQKEVENENESDSEVDNEIEKMNNELNEKEITISKDENENFSIEKNGAKANTHFPLSINPETKELTITTPAGTKVVAILPDEAIEHVLQEKIINSVETEAASDSASQKATLTTLNNEAVFKINGFSSKKVLGFIPVSFAKTVFVSAENGKIIKTDETFLNKILEALSF